MPAVCAGWEGKLGPLQEQKVLLLTKPLLQPYFPFSFFKCVVFPMYMSVPLYTSESQKTSSGICPNLLPVETGSCLMLQCATVW